MPSTVGVLPDTPYLGDKGYLPHRAPRAAYAAMITRLDRDVGRLAQLVRDLGLDRDTLIVFTSDNGPTFNGGTDSAFFESAGPFRGLKTMVYEGGIRVPMVARWPGMIPAGTVSAHASAFEDYMPTFAEMAGVAASGGIDGVSMLRGARGTRVCTEAPRIPLLGVPGQAGREAGRLEGHPERGDRRVRTVRPGEGHR